MHPSVGVRNNPVMRRDVPTIDEIVAGYLQGVFPMDIDGRVGFYGCDPRGVIPLDGFRIPRSVMRALRRGEFTVRVDHAFDDVVDACGGARHDGEWLSARLAGRYRELHESGLAHSVEIWRGDALVGGLFGIAVGGLFTSESMFHRASDAGSAALVATHRHLVERGFTLWDIQMTSEHTQRFGAIEIAGDDYLVRLRGALATQAGVWSSAPAGGVSDH